MADPDYFMNCGECGVRFSMPSSLNDWFREDARRTFYCPHGHARHYSNKDNDINKMRRERDRLKQHGAYLEDEKRRQTNRALAAERSASAYKGAATRLKNRAKAGVCPCCSRHFTNLERHMKSQHKDADMDTVIELGQAN